MTLTTAQALQGLYADYAEISEADTAILKAMVAGDLDRMNADRFTGDDLTILEACLMLDAWVNRPGTGPVTEERTKDTAWKTKIESSSYYMDKALKKIKDYDEKTGTGTFEVATRADSSMPELSELEFEEYYEEA